MGTKGDQSKLTKGRNSSGRIINLEIFDISGGQFPNDPSVARKTLALQQRNRLPDVLLPLCVTLVDKQSLEIRDKLTKAGHDCDVQYRASHPCTSVTQEPAQNRYGNPRRERTERRAKVETNDRGPIPPMMWKPREQTRGVWPANRLLSPIWPR